MTPRQFKKQQLEKFSIQKATPHQKISNTFIDNVISNSNLNALKTIYYLASVLEKMEQLKEVSNNASLLTVEIDTRDMLKYTEMTLPDIRRNIKAMQETSITFVDESERIEEGMSLLPRYKILYGKNKIELNLFKVIAQMIVDVKRNYTMLNTKELMQLKSKHSLRLLPLLQKISNYSDHVGKRKRMDLDELNDLFGTKYKKIAEIERKILIPVKEELDNNCKLTFIYEVDFINLGSGRPKAKDITIDVVERNNYQSKLF